jgi:hypothetical protein
MFISASTVIIISKETLPAALNAVTVNEVAAVIVVGVPEMIQVEVSKESPSGKLGEML